VTLISLFTGNVKAGIELNARPRRVEIPGAEYLLLANTSPPGE